jgi:hypothetical protein
MKYLLRFFSLFAQIYRFALIMQEGKQNSPNPVVIVVEDDGKIKAGFIDPLSMEGGPVELLTDDCGISRVDDVCERFDGPRFP